MSLALRLGLVYLGILGLIYIVLMLNVVRLRRKHKIGLGTGNQPELEKAIRMHGNFSEYVPLMALMLIVLELSGFNHLALHVFWIALTFSRVCHAAGIHSSANQSPGRFVGAALTCLCLLAISLSLIVHFIILGPL